MTHDPNNKSRRELKSGLSKPFYKKWSVWLVIILVVIVGTIGIYDTGEKGQTVDESREQEKGKKTNNDDQKTTKDAEPTNSDPEDTPEKIDYEDFKGTYVEFEGEPYNSPITPIGSNILVLGDNSYQGFNRWDFNMTSTILDKTIEGNTLTLELDSDENEMWGAHSETGKEQFKLDDSGDSKVLHHQSSEDLTYYSMSSQDLQSHYSQSEIDYARIIMTINGVPSLDSWAVWESENDGNKPVVRISYNKSGDSTDVSDQVKYPADVTHIKLTEQGMYNEVITYSTVRDGYIKIYPMPLDFHQEDQSDEGYKQLGQEGIDSAEEIEIEAF